MLADTRLIEHHVGRVILGQSKADKLLEWTLC